MKHFATVMCMAFAATAFASTRVEVSALPSGEYADTEVSTNVALTVNAARLERLTIAVSVDSCETNEVLVALGADADDDGDLSIDEADVVFGCDCGAWYRAEDERRAAEHEFAFAADAARRRTFFDRIYRINRI